MPGQKDRATVTFIDRNSPAAMLHEVEGLSPELFVCVSAVGEKNHGCSKLEKWSCSRNRLTGAGDALPA